MSSVPLRLRMWLWCGQGLAEAVALRKGCVSCCHPDCVHMDESRTQAEAEATVCGHRGCREDPALRSLCGHGSQGPGVWP